MKNLYPNFEDLSKLKLLTFIIFPNNNQTLITGSSNNRDNFIEN